MNNWLNWGFWLVDKFKSVTDGRTDGHLTWEGARDACASKNEKMSFFWNHHCDLKLIASSHSDDFKANSFKSQWWFQKNDISLMLTILDTLDTFSSSLFWTYFWENNFMDIFCTRFFVHFFDTFFLHFFSCPSSSIPTLVTHWLTDWLFWIQLQTFDQTIPDLPDQPSQPISWPTCTT